MSLTEVICFAVVGVVACFGIITVTLFESAMDDIRILQRRQDFLESRIYVLEQCKNLSEDKCDDKGYEQAK